MSSIKIISVESRKGGVGKSTVALNLASLLNDRNNRVLLIDVDITGTSIDGFMKSSLWKEEFNSVLFGNKKINLLDYFQNYFQNGRNTIEFISNSQCNFLSENCFQIREDSINYIQSELYDENMSVICDPRLLFDELHSYWLVQMLDDICNAFDTWVSKQEKKKDGIIILDNSPGYVGLDRAIHEWLTNLGPEKAKFLTVSSLDVQDLKSSLSSIKVIHEIVERKIKGARLCRELERGNNDIFFELVDEKVKSFVVHRLLSAEATGLEYYTGIKDDENPEIGSYQALVINKVPVIVYDNMKNYDYKKSLGKEELYKLLESICSTKNGMIETIPFDSYIQYQLVRDYVTHSNFTKDDSRVKILNSITSMRRILTSMNIGVRNHLSYIDSLWRLDVYFNRLKKELVEVGYGQLARKLDVRWSPAYPLIHMQLCLIDLGLQSKIKPVWSKKSFVDFDEVRSFLRIHFPSLSTTISSFKSNSSFVRDWIFYNELLCYYMLDYALDDNLNKELLKDIEIQLVGIIKYQNRNLLFNQRRSLQQSSDLSLHNRFFRGGGTKELSESFSMAQIRFFNMNDHMEALLKTMELLTSPEESDNQKLIETAMIILDTFIVEMEINNKQVFFENLKKATKESHKMQEFQHVLSAIRKKWKL